MKWGRAIGGVTIGWFVGCGGTGTQTAIVANDAAAEVAPTTAPFDAGVEVEAAPDPHGPPYPIILAHGMGGFGTLKGLNLQYFNGIKDDLAAHGETMVFATIVPAYDTSENRAAQLGPQIDKILEMTGKSKVNIIGHSQGGMDARVLVSPSGLGYGDRVATVTTVATPHRGSQVADVALKILDPLGYSADAITNAILNLLEETVYDLNSNANLHAQLNELSEHYMVNTFNPKYGNDPRVEYFSYAGRSGDSNGLPDCADALYPDDPTKVDDGQAILQPTISFLADGANKKPNDGLVTVQSAQWGAFLQCVPADHASEVGQIDITTPNAKSGYDHLAFFRTVVSRIRARGF
jgi:triacylglycerol lipase